MRTGLDVAKEVRRGTSLPRRSCYRQVGSPAGHQRIHYCTHVPSRRPLRSNTVNVRPVKKRFLRRRDAYHQLNKHGLDEFLGFQQLIVLLYSHGLRSPEFPRPGPNTKVIASRTYSQLSGTHQYSHLLSSLLGLSHRYLFLKNTLCFRIRLRTSRY